MIELGLARISRLIQHTPLPRHAIHVAGTNGKGSICAYVSAMLHAGGIYCGRYTSPHLIDRWDSITIEEQPISESLFREAESRVLRRNAELELRATEFELLTATAFEIFHQKKIDVAVVEVGLGGRQDATNVLETPLVTVISKIGLDHQSFLGNTIEDIAREKAGILKPHVPYVVDGTNQAEAIETIRRVAGQVRAGPLHLCSLDCEIDPDLANFLSSCDFEDHQKQNIIVALEAVKIALEELGVKESPSSLLPALTAVNWPGRLQCLTLSLPGSPEKGVLLDGAHNPQSAAVLAKYVDRHMRLPGKPMTWVFAMSQGKDATEVLHILLKPGDTLITVPFGPADGMPWVRPFQVEDLLAAAKSIKLGDRSMATDDLLDGLRIAIDVAKDGPLAIAGSLYLVSDVLRSQRITNK